MHPNGQFARYSEWTGRNRVEHLVHFESGRHIGAFESVEDAEGAAEELRTLGGWRDLKVVKAIGKALIRDVVEAHGGELA